MMHRLQAEEELRMVSAVNAGMAGGKSRQFVDNLRMSAKGIRGEKLEEVKRKHGLVVAEFRAIMAAGRRKGG